MKHLTRHDTPRGGNASHLQVAQTLARLRDAIRASRVRVTCARSLIARSDLSVRESDCRVRMSIAHERSVRAGQASLALTDRVQRVCARSRALRADVLAQRAKRSSSPAWPHHAARELLRLLDHVQSDLHPSSDDDVVAERLARVLGAEDLAALAGSLLALQGQLGGRVQTRPTRFRPSIGAR